MGEDLCALSGVLRAIRGGTAAKPEFRLEVKEK